MTALKANEVEGFLRKPDLSVRVILIHGPDGGLVSERANKVAASSAFDTSDPFSTIRLDSDDLSGDAIRLVDEASTVSMFGSRRLIRVRGADSAPIAHALRTLLDMENLDSVVLIEAGDLKKTNPVRKVVEQHRLARALPCYADTAQSIDLLIDSVLRDAKLGIEDEARERLAGLLGANRMVSRGELDKLVLYAGSQSPIDIEMVEAIVGDGSALALDRLVDAAGLGDLDQVDTDLKRFELSGTSAAAVSSAAIRHFQMLHRARSEMAATNRSVQKVVDGMRPPLFFQRKAKVTRQLSIWSLASLDRALQRLDQAVFTGRTTPALAFEAMSGALVAIGAMARSQARRSVSG